MPKKIAVQMLNKKQCLVLISLATRILIFMVTLDSNEPPLIAVSAGERGGGGGGSASERFVISELLFPYSKSFLEKI